MEDYLETQNFVRIQEIPSCSLEVSKCLKDIIKIYSMRDSFKTLIILFRDEKTNVKVYLERKINTFVGNKYLLH